MHDTDFLLILDGLARRFGDGLNPALRRAMAEDGKPDEAPTEPGRRAVVLRFPRGGRHG